MRKILAIVLAVSMLMATGISTQASQAPEAEEGQIIELKSFDDTTAENYYQELLAAELYNYKVVRNIPVAYSEESWNAYMGIAAFTAMMNKDALEDRDKETLENIKTARESLEQIKDKKDVMWMLWGNDMPVAADEETVVFEDSHFDNADFMPYLVPYILEDQSQVVGNLIVVPGGGYQTRSIDNEGFPICEAFNERGYNCFMLSRRVEPYAPEDSFLDMQRAVRYLRFLR